MSIGFKAIQDSIVIVRHNTLFKQCKAYQRKGRVYIGVCGGYARLRADGATTQANITWVDIDGVEDVKIEPTSGKWIEYTGEEE